MAKPKSALGMTSPFDPWLRGKQPLPTRFYVKSGGDLIDDRWDCWVGPSLRVPLHQATTLEWFSLRESRKRTQEFLSKAEKIVQGLDGAWLDGWEREEMRKSKLVPPPLCFPIYLITCENNEAERIVYVGQTSASNRFSGGHAAALKLHDPKYSPYKKWIYQCTVCLYFEHEYIFFEWVDPLEIAISVLNDVESQLIFDLQPELNSAKRKANAAKTPVRIHMQRIMPDTRLPDMSFYPPK